MDSYSNAVKRAKTSLLPIKGVLSVFGSTDDENGEPIIVVAVERHVMPSLITVIPLAIDGVQIQVEVRDG